MRSVYVDVTIANEAETVSGEGENPPSGGSSIQPALLEAEPAEKWGIWNLNTRKWMQRVDGTVISFDTRAEAYAQLHSGSHVAEHEAVKIRSITKWAQMEAPAGE